MSQSDYKVRIGITWVDETSPPAKKAKKGLDGVAKAAKAMFGAAVVRQGVKFAIELTKIGATAERQANALNNLAAAAGESGTEIISAIQEASDFTIDKMGAMAAANRAMVMDVAKSPDEFERLTKVAIALGRAMGVDAVKSIDDFITAGGRQSKLIADNLGLVVVAEDAYKRYAEANNMAVDEMDDAAKKQAFLTEMLRQGETKMADLGDQHLDTAGQIEQSSAAWKDAKTALGQMIATAASASGVMGKFTEEMQSVTSRIEELAGSEITFQMIDQAMAESWNTGEEGIVILRRLQEQYSHTSREIERYSYVVQQSAEIGRYAIDAEREQGMMLSELSYVSDETKDSLNRLVRSDGDVLHTILQTSEVIRREGIPSQDELMRTVLEAASALEEEGKAGQLTRDQLLDLNKAAMDVADTHLSMASNYTSYQKDVEESAADFAKRREKIEEDHADKVAKIWQRGQSRAIKFDEAAQREKIKRMREDLVVTLQSQADMGEKSKESTRMRMQLRIDRAQEGLAKEEQLLDTYLAGRLVKEGANVNALMAEEDRRYAESILSLEEAQTEQEASQKESLGRMVLQHFNAWVSMTLAADGFTKQEVKYITETRMQISEQYGLVTQAAIGEMEAQELEWKRTMAIMTGDAENFFDFFMQQFDALPSEKVMRIRTELSEAPTDIARQRGGPVRAGNPYIVGESGPELFVPGSSGRVVSNSQAFDSHDTYNFNTPHGPVTALEAQRRQRRQRMGRVM